MENSPVFMRSFTALSIFPELFDPFWSTGMIRKAIQEGHLSGKAMDLRDFTEDRHKTTDDKPYGGGCGMVMKPEPLMAAIKAAKKECPESLVILTSPQGKPFHQAMAQDLSREKGLIFVCGRYEGIDERVVLEADLELSIGDYVLTGGELAAMVIMDAVARLIPGVLGGGEESAEVETFSGDLMEYAQYTRPPEFEGKAVPEILLSGNHAEIRKWRLESSLQRTLLKRPDLLEKRELGKEERKILKSWGQKLLDLGEGA